MVLEDARFTGAGGDDVRGIVGIPSPAERELAGAVVLVHGGAGIDDIARQGVRRLSEAGFAVIAPDLCSREGSSADPVPDRRAAADLEAAIDVLIGRFGIGADRVGTLGLFEGGTHAFLFGCASRRIAAVAAIAWPVVAEELSASRPVQPLELALNLSAPLLALFAEGGAVPPEHVEALSQVGSQFAKDFDIVVLPGDELFSEPETVNEVWARTLAFLRERLRGPEE